MNQHPLRNVLVVLNPIAGQASPATIHAALDHYFTRPNWACTVHELSGDEDAAELTRAACQQGANLVVAAGGDGTVVAVANGLVKSQIPLGILPLGTGNGFARGLNIPLDLESALKLLVGEPAIQPVDALQVNDRCYVLNVSVGLSPQIMRSTPPEQKRRLGVFAYIWTMLKRWGSFRARRYKVTVDGKPRWIIGSEILISNGTVLDSLSSLVGPPETFADNQLEAYIITARTPADYLRLLWNVGRHPRARVPRLSHWVVKKEVSIETVWFSQLVQADGEVIGRTPVKIDLVANALRVLVPKPKTERATI